MKTGNRPINIALSNGRHKGTTIAMVPTAYVQKNGLAIHRERLRDGEFGNDWVITLMKVGGQLPFTYARKHKAVAIAKAMSEHSPVTNFDDLPGEFGKILNANGWAIIRDAYIAARQEVLVEIGT